MSPLSLAAEHGHEAVVRLLLEGGADVNATGRRRRSYDDYDEYDEYEYYDDETGTALIWATENGHEAVVRLLLEDGADVNATLRFPGREEEMAQIWAAENGHEAVVRLLLKGGADGNAIGPFVYVRPISSRKHIKFR